MAKKGKKYIPTKAVLLSKLPLGSFQPKFHEAIVTDPKTPTTYGKEHATSNTTKDAKTKGYYTEVTGFQSYRLLQLIRQGKNNTTCGDSFSKKDLFQSGDLFSTRLYTRIFSNRNIFPFAPCLMNNEKDFKFAISFDSVTAELATITISKII